MNPTTKLRVAVLSRGDSFESWEANALRAAYELPFAEIVLVVEDGSEVQTHRSFANRVGNYTWSRLFWNRWFRKFGKVSATEHVTVSDLFATAAKMKVVPELRGKFSQHFSSADIEKIKSFQPDVILRFGFNILRGEILDVAKHGIWSYHHADHETIRGGPAGFWEFILGHNHTGAILQRLTDKLDDGTVLRKGYFPLVKHSFRENLNRLLKGTSGWMANALTEIHLHGKIYDRHIRIAERPPVYLYPGNFRMVHFWMILLKNKFRFQWRTLFCPETWKIGIVDQPYTNVLEHGVVQEPKWISAKPSSEYLADPFLLELHGEKIILAEEYSYVKGKGRIVNAETGKVWIEADYHLSFPFTYSDKNFSWIIPEMSAKGSLMSFEAGDGSPAQFLLDKPVVDPVLCFYEGRYWLFCNRLDAQNNSALFIYHTDNVLHGFTPHALNPVKTDIRNSRPAGPVSMINGKLIRPAQDSSTGYGSRIVVNEITLLTPDRFEEHAIKYIVPDKNWDYNKGLHTVSPYGTDRTLIDVKSFRFNFANFKAECKRKTRRIFGR